MNLRRTHEIFSTIDDANYQMIAPHIKVEMWGTQDWNIDYNRREGKEIVIVEPDTRVNEVIFILSGATFTFKRELSYIESINILYRGDFFNLSEAFGFFINGVQTINQYGLATSSYCNIIRIPLEIFSQYVLPKISLGTRFELEKPENNFNKIYKKLPNVFENPNFFA